MRGRRYVDERGERERGREDERGREREVWRGVKWRSGEREGK